jgi:hypothetical protein
VLLFAKILIITVKKEIKTVVEPDNIAPPKNKNEKKRYDLFLVN